MELYKQRENCDYKRKNATKVCVFVWSVHGIWTLVYGVDKANSKINIFPMGCVDNVHNPSGNYRTEKGRRTN